MSGVVLIEALLATSIMSMVGIAVLVGLTTGFIGTQNLSNGRAAMDIAQSQMESVKDQDFRTDGSYTPFLAGDPELPDGFTISVAATKTDGNPLDGTEQIQLITVTVTYETHNGDKDLILEGYKSSREIS